MIGKVIPLVDQRATRHAPIISTHAFNPGGALADTRGRLLRDLRISVTDPFRHYAGADLVRLPLPKAGCSLHKSSVPFCAFDVRNRMSIPAINLLARGRPLLRNSLPDHFTLCTEVGHVRR